MAFLSSLRQIISGKSELFPESKDSSQTILRIIQAIALCLGMSIVLGMIASYFVTDIPDNAHLIAQYLKEVSPLQAAATIALIGPIMEEMMFRMGLKPTRWTLSISLGMISVWIITTLLSFSLPEVTTTELVERRSLIGILYRIIPFALAIGTWYLALRMPWFQGRISTLHRHWYVSLWLTSILFGRAHITNFTDKGIWYLVPLLTLPQTLIGFVLGAMRLQGKRRHTMIIHCVYNGLLVVPIIVIMAAGIDINSIQKSIDLTMLSQLQIMAVGGVSLFMMMLFVSVVVVNGYSVWEAWKRK